MNYEVSIMNDFLYTYSNNTYSANGEDGINKQLLNHLDISEGVVLEIGAWDGFFDSNCANLWVDDENFKAVLVESTDRLQKEVLEQKYNNVACFNEFITRNNSLENIIDRCNFKVNKSNFVLASIDVDGDDLNVARSLGKYKPIILIVESNGDLIEKRNPSGSSIQELVEFGIEFGYEFIGMSGFVGKHSGNLYFVRKDYKSKFKICKKPWIERGILLSGGVVYE